MPTMNNRQSVAANAKVNGVFSGQLHEYVQESSIVRIFATASAVGLNINVNVGGETIVSDQEVNAQNRMPLRPDDLVNEISALPGDRIIVDWRNTTAGALTGFVTVDIVPV